MHIGLPDDIGSYIQETGRAGRDGQISMATLLQTRIYHKVDEDIKVYVANSSKCRWNVLFGDMDNYTPDELSIKCLCCDVCARSYVCGLCESRLKQFVLFSVNKFIIASVSLIKHVLNNREYDMNNLKSKTRVLMTKGHNSNYYSHVH